jgi:hypothetical protein
MDSVGMAMAPARIISSEHTVAKTGRRIKNQRTKFGLRAYAWGMTGMPSIRFWVPPIITVSPGFNPSSMT